MSKSLLLSTLFIVFLNFGCVQEETSDISPNQNAPQNPHFDGLGLSITTPKNNDSAMEHVMISGHCSDPGFPIEVKTTPSSSTIYSICQQDFTWVAALHTQSFQEGAINIEASIQDPSTLQIANAPQVSLIKGQDLCPQEKHALLFANINDVDGITEPFVICNSEQFTNMRFHPDKKFILGRSINFSNKVISPMPVSFTGELDGQGFQISNLIVKDLTGNSDSIGIFRFAHNATIKNLNIKNAISEGTQRVGILAGAWRGSGQISNIKVQGKSSGISYIGGLIGLANTSAEIEISDLELEVEVIGNNYVGGLISYIVSNDGFFNLSNAKVLSKVQGLNYTGGVIGRSLQPDTTLSDIERIGNVSSQGMWVGGIAGEFFAGGNLNKVRNIGTVETTRDAQDVFVGGFIGEARGVLNINDSENIGHTKSGGHYTGGIVGRVHTLNLEDTISRGKITVLDDYYDSVVRFTGGIAGGVSLNSSLLRAEVFTEIEAKARYVGGLVGTFNGQQSTIESSYYQGKITAFTSHIGGLVGVFNGDSIKNSFSRPQLHIHNPTPNSFIGGVVGLTTKNSSFYQRLYSRGDIYIHNGIADYVGGLFGRLEGESLAQAYFHGSIQGARSKIGGLAGASRANIQQSYTNSDIDAGFRYIGALVGIAHGVNIDNSFAIGELIGQGEVGGLVGWFNADTNSLSRSFFLGNITRVANENFADETFGQVVGLTSPSASYQNIFYLNTNNLTTPEQQSVESNNIAQSLSSSQLRNTIYYNDYVFDANNWKEPIGSGFKLPHSNTDYQYAAPAWVAEPNQGFDIVKNFTSNPIEQPVSSIFISDANLLNQLDNDVLEILYSESDVNIEKDSMNISIIGPSSNSQKVSGKQLVYGECGKPGEKIVIEGDFNLFSICQENYRWSAVLDISKQPLGNLNFNVHMKSYDGSQVSNTESKTLIKSNDLCEQSEAISGTFANSYLGADGVSTPFKICHAGHFNNIAYHPDKKFELANDIDFGHNTIQPIMTTFTGEIDGFGHSLKNFIISRPTSIGVGIFRLIKDARIENLSISNADVTGHERVGILSGSWVGQGTLKNVNVSGKVKGILYTGGLFGLANTGVDLHLEDINSSINVQGNNFTGGLLGHISTLNGSLTAKNLELNNTVKGLENVGGLIGSSLEQNVQFEDVTISGSVEALRKNLGGLAGHLRGGSLININVSADLNSKQKAQEANAGGITGLVELTTFNLNGAVYSGQIQAGADNVGGIIGKLTQGSITNAQSSGSIVVNDDKFDSVRAYVGGLIGHILEDSSLNNSFSQMDIDAKARFTGGLVGRFHGKDSILINSFFQGSIKAYTSFIGGVAGFFFGEQFHDNYSTANIEVHNPTPNAYIGGIVGYANSWTSDYQRIYATGDIDIMNGIADYVGGLIGYFRGGSLKECYATGNITGVRNASGGLVGLHRGLTENCYSSGNVQASLRHNGGLIGYLLNGEIRNSFTLSNLEAAEQSGGLVGYANNQQLNSISHSYAYGQITQTEGATANPLTLGPIIGVEAIEGNVQQSTVNFLSSQYITGQNEVGTSLSIEQASQASNYTGFDFSSPSMWRMPDQDFTLPSSTSDYNYPIFEWLGQGIEVSQYSLAGNIEGLNYGEITLWLNNDEQIHLNSNQSSFTFNTMLVAGTPYSISVTTNPLYSGVECSVINANGVMGTNNINNIMVSCPSLESVSISPKDQSLGLGTELQMQAIGHLSNSVNLNLTSEVNWQSSNSSVASINQNGLIQTLALGNTQITASLIGFSDQSQIDIMQSLESASNIAWQQSSPHNETSMGASWTPSPSLNLSEQVISLYNNSNCSGTAQVEHSLNTSTGSYLFQGSHQQSYSFHIKSISLDGISALSACSGELKIELDPPNPVSGIASAAVWISGEEPFNSPSVSWSNPQGEDIQNIFVGLGANFGADNIVNFTPIGTNNNYTFTNLSGLIECAPYFPVVKVVNSIGLESEITTDTVGFRWDKTPPEQIEAIAINGEATENSTPQFSWSAPNDNCALRFYELAIGTTPATTDVSGGFKPIGNTTSFTALSGLLGFNFTLTPGESYYTHVRAVDYANNKAIAAVSEAWNVVDLQNELPDLILWLDSADTLTILDNDNNSAEDEGFFNQRVKTWVDKSGSTNQHNFWAVNSQAEPYLINDRIFFNGSNHFFTTNNHDEINLSTVAEKNITFAIKTENNISSNQVIYEEGGAIRGMNIYISEGKLYCGFWNVVDDGDGAQEFVSVSTDISANSHYSISWVFDYSHYDGPSGPDGHLECYVNNTLIGQGSSTTRVFPHSGAIGIGAMYNDTYYHTGPANGNGDHFRGEILEAMITNESITSTTIETIHNYLAGKWQGEDLSKPANLFVNNNSTTIQSAIASWEPISASLFDTASYEIAIGQTPGGTEDLFWLNIGNVTQYQVQDGFDGASLSLEYGTDYYISIRAIDNTGNYSQVATSIPWRLFDFNTELTQLVLYLRGHELSSIIDQTDTSADQAGFTGQVQSWQDLSTSAFDHTPYSIGSTRPVFNELDNELVFSGNSVMQIDNSDEINTQTLDQKNITISFSTSLDVSNRQVLYEEGGTVRGMNIYIEGENIYCGFWNATDDGDGNQGFIAVSKSIAANQDYVISWDFDYSNYDGPDGPDGKLNCYLNTEFVGSANTVSRIFPHPGLIGLGGQNNGSYFHNGSNNANQDFFFNGSIRDVIINNETLRTDIVQQLHNQLLPIAP